MGKRKSVPEDLMGNILSESLDTGEADQTLSETGGPPGDVFSWDEGSERVGVTFNLSKQLATELERLRWELRSENDVRPSRSELVEVALRIAVDDVMQGGEASELARRLAERRASRASDIAGAIRLSVDQSGWIFETTHDESGYVVDEDVVGTVADLPVVDEYVDLQGRLVSVSKDELGNTFEQVMDEEFNTLETRLLETWNRGVR